MIDFYTVSGVIVAVTAGFCLYNWKFRNDDTVDTDINVPSPLVPVADPIEIVHTSDFSMIDVNRIIKPETSRKRNVGGRVAIPDAVLTKLQHEYDDLVFSWSRDVTISGPGSVTISGGGTPTSKFVDLKLTRKSTHLEVMAFGTVRCDVMHNDKVIASGVGHLHLGIIPAGILL